MNRKSGTGRFLPKMGNYLSNKKYSLLYLVIGFILTLVVLGVFVILSNQRLKALISYSDQVEQTYQAIETIEKISNRLKDAETAVRGFVITKDSSYLDPLFKARLDLPVLMDSIKLLTADNEMQRMRLGMLHNTLLLRMKILEDAIPLVNDGTYNEVMIDRMAKGKQMMNNFRMELEIIRKEEQALLHDRFLQKETYQKLTPGIFRQLSIVVGFVSIALFVLLLLEFLRRLRFQKALQQQVDAIRQSNDELTQLAFAASHDLQEPVRKMRIFTDRLLMKQKKSLPAEELMILGRIDYSARRLQGMLEDISNYMDLIGSVEEKIMLDMRKALHEVIRKNEPAIQEAQAQIQVDPLPELFACPSQIKLIFQALLDNALKFSKPGIPPSIRIYSEPIKAEQLKELIESPLHARFWVIHFTDNGMGFDNVYRSKIFQLFRRLHHQDEFSGRGIGLAICQRVMSNHQGFISAIGKPGEGARFMLFFPMD